MSARRLTACALFWLLPLWASAWPVDQVVRLGAGEAHFERAGAVAFVDVQRPEVLRAEAFESGEVLLHPLAAGESLVLLYFREGRFAVWRVQVGPRSPASGAGPTALEAATRACPGLEVRGASLVVRVAGGPCRGALGEVLRSDRFMAGELALTFELEALVEQLEAIQRALPEPLRERVELAYLGAGLRVSGTVSEEERRAVLWAVFHSVVGRVALEDRLETKGGRVDPAREEEEP